MALTLVTASTEEPLTLPEARDHLRVDSETEDAFIEALITAARSHAENFLSRKLITQTWDWTLDSFDGCALARVLVAPLVSVTSITYLDSAGASQTLATSVYRVDAKTVPGRITLDYGQTWPSTRNVTNAVTVRLVAGYGTREDVPRPICHAMLLLIGQWFAARESIGNIVTELPFGVQALLMPYRVWGF